MVGTKGKVALGLAGLATLIGTAIILSPKEAAGQETGSLAGAVIDNVTRLPIQGATVEAEGKSTITDVNGQWALTGLPVGNVTVTFDAPGYGVFQSVYTIVSGVQTTIGDIGLTPEVLALSITAQPETGFAPLTVGFSSAPCCAGPYSWLWNFGDGAPTQTQKNPNHIYTTPGTYVATLTVTDSLGRTISKTITIIVQSSVGSVAGRVIDSSTSSPLAGASVSIDGYSATSDGAGNFSIAGIPSGSYTLTVSSPNYSPTSQPVTIVAGQMTSMTQTNLTKKYVGDVGLPPATTTLTVRITARPASGEAPFMVGFDSFPDGGETPYDFLWDFGDAKSSIWQNPVHIYDLPGIYAATCTVKDAAGRIVVSSVLNVTATSAEPPTVEPPTLSLSVSPLSGDAPLSIIGSVVAAGGTPPYIYLWDQGETTDSINRTYSNPGTYNVSCTVFDANGLSDFQTKQITVNSPAPPGGIPCWWPGEPAETGTYVDVSCDMLGNPSSDFGGTYPRGWLINWNDFSIFLYSHPDAGNYPNTSGGSIPNGYLIIWAPDYV